VSPTTTRPAGTADLFDDFRAGPFEALDKPALLSHVVCGVLGAVLLFFVLRTPVRPIESMTIEQLPERVSRLLLNESDLARLTKPERLAVPEDMVAPGQTKKSEEAEAPPTESEVAPPSDAVGVPQRGSRGGGGGAGGPGAGGVAAAANVAATLGATGTLAEVDRIVGDFTGVVASERGGKALRQGGAGSGIERRAGTPGARTRTGADLGGVDEILGGAGGGSGGRGSAGTAAGLGGGSGGAGRPQVRIAAPAAIAGSEAAGAGRQPGALMAVVQRHAAAVRFCYNRYLQKKPGATGQLVLRLTVAADGAVTSATVARSTFNDSELESCVVGQAREWRFAPAEEASFTFDVPFVFTPPSEG
jgi:TonB family protein